MLGAIFFKPIMAPSERPAKQMDEDNDDDAPMCLSFGYSALVQVQGRYRWYRSAPLRTRTRTRVEFLRRKRRGKDAGVLLFDPDSYFSKAVWSIKNTLNKRR
jgi:hypothetical protein